MFRLIETNLVCGFTAVGVDFWNYRIGKPEPFVFLKKKIEKTIKRTRIQTALCVLKQVLSSPVVYTSIFHYSK